MAGNDIVQDGLGDHVIGLRKYALALCRNRDEAEDLVQESLTRAIAGAGSFRPDLPLRPWLFRILKNAFLNGRRARSREQEGAGGSLESEASMVAPQETRYELARVLEALERLPLDQRQVLRLVALEELSYAEAAATLGIPIGTLMSRLARGREGLRRMVEGEHRPRLEVVGGRS